MRLALLALLLFASCSAGATEATTQPIVWRQLSGADDNVVIRGNAFVQENAGRPWSAERAANLTCDAFRFEVRPGDQWSEDIKSGENKERSEFDGYKKRWDDKASVWGAYSFLIEPGVSYHSDWTAISQMNGSEVRPFAVQFKGDDLFVYTAHLENGREVGNPRYSAKLRRGVWHTAVFHLVQSSSNGVLDFWLDGAKIVSFRGPIGSDGNQAYWKFGIYRGYGPIATPLAVEYANMEVGTRDLSERVGKPLSVD